MRSLKLERVVNLLNFHILLITQKYLLCLCLNMFYVNFDSSKTLISLWYQTQQASYASVGLSEGCDPQESTFRVWSSTLITQCLWQELAKYCLSISADARASYAGF